MKRPPILILHGWSLSADRYTPLIQELSRMGYSAYAPDLPGFGTASIPKKPLQLNNYVDFVEKYIKKHAIVNPIIIGHSFGGRVAIKYASVYGPSLTGIILSGTPGYPSVKKWKWFLSYLISKFGNMLFSLLYFHGREEKIRSWFYTIVGAKDYSRAGGVMRETFKNIVSEKLHACMKQIRIPSLLLWGERDILVPLWVAKKMHKTLINSTVVVLTGVGHNVVITNPKRVAQEVHRFIQSV